jgi:hypothetical protein
MGNRSGKRGDQTFSEERKDIKGLDNGQDETAAGTANFISD